MAKATKAIRENCMITVNFHNEVTYFELISNGKASSGFVNLTDNASIAGNCYAPNKPKNPF